jgi:FtsH-binding integral membrane protein
MYRIVVIKNAIEMQHSGYVDPVPNYIRTINDSKVIYDKFSGVNINELFKEGNTIKTNRIMQNILICTVIAVFIATLICLIIKLVLWVFFDDFKPMYEIYLILIDVVTFCVLVKVTKPYEETGVTRVRWFFGVVFIINFFVVSINLLAYEDAIHEHREYWQYALFALMFLSLFIFAIIAVINKKRYNRMS